MEPPFRGLVLGLSLKQVDDTLRNHGLKAQVRAFRPLTTLLLGLSRKTLLERSDIPLRPFRYDLPVLHGLWAVTAILFFVTLASFLGGPVTTHQPLLVLATTVLATAALVVTVSVAMRPKHPALEVDEYLRDLPVWALISDPFFGLVVTLLVLLIVFLLFFVWLPLLLLFLSVLSLGGLWKAYRTCIVVSEDDHRLPLVGRELLRMGAVLSRTWDSHLDPSDTHRSTEARRCHVSLHRAFVTVGLSSLGLGIMVLLSRAIPWEGWIVVLISFAGLTAAALLVFSWRARSRITLGRLT